MDSNPPAISELGKRVEQFRALELPGQPLMLHMGTSQLVEDLWRTVRILSDMLSHREGSQHE